MRSFILIVTVAGAYTLLRGWQGSPALLLRSCLAVAALVAGLALWGIRKNPSRHRMLNLRRATWLDYLSLGAAIVFTEVCFVVITSTLTTPAQDAIISLQKKIPDSNLFKKNSILEFGGNKSGNWLFDKNLKRTLPPNSNHKPSTKPEVFLQLENSEDAVALLNSRIHLRAFAFSHFDGTSWSAPQSNKNQLTSPILFPSRPSENTINYRVYHAINPTGQNLFTALHGATSTDLPALTQLSESIHLLPKLTDKTDGYNYAASSSPIHFSDLIGTPVTTAGNSSDALALPVELSVQLRKTAELWRDKPDLTSRLNALRDHLHNNYHYSLTTTNSRGDNALQNFLYMEKRGYCEHFATAAAMLCRTLGVPSRIAYGWSGGKLYKAQNMFVFRAKDAHAWTEIKLQDYGWVVFDTTPADDDATPQAHTAADGETAPDPRQTIAQQQLANGISTDTYARLGIKPHTLYTALCAIGFFCAVLLIARNSKRLKASANAHSSSSPQPSYLTHFRHSCAALGHPMPNGSTLRQHIDILLKNNTAPEFTSDLLDYHYGVTYSKNPKNPSTEKRLNRAIHQWKKLSPPTRAPY